MPRISGFCLIHNNLQLQIVVFVSCGSQFLQGDDREEGKGMHPDSLLSLPDDSLTSSLHPSGSAGIDD